MRIVITSLMCALVCSLCSSFALADTSSTQNCDQLLKISDMETYLDEAFGPYDGFENDKEPLKNAMKAQGLSDRSIDENINALGKFAQHVQAVKGPLMQDIKADLSQKLSNAFTPAEIAELIRLFNSPVMQKFKKFSTDVMPQALKTLHAGKQAQLKQPFEDLQKSLVIAQGTPTQKPA